MTDEEHTWQHTWKFLPEHQRLADRLVNWKFKSASEYAQILTLPDGVQEQVESLNKMFGNCGWFEGDMGNLVEMAVYGLLSRLEAEAAKQP